MTKSVKCVTEKCPICLQNNPLNSKRWFHGSLKEETVIAGITGRLVFLSYHANKDRGISWYYLLDTFSGWPEAFLCCTNEAREFTKVLFKEIIPRFGVPVGMSSDRRPHFISEVVEQLSMQLGYKLGFTFFIESAV